MIGGKPYGDTAHRRLRAIAPAATIVLALAVSGCSGNVSRFDFASAFENRKSSDEKLTTASLPPVPREPVYDVEERRLSDVESDGQTKDYSRLEQSREVSRAPLAAPRATAQPVSRTPAPSRPRAQKASHEIEVKRGDTLYSLSRRYDTPVEQIRAANDMRGNRLSIGQVLRIPTAYQPSTYTVKRGDSIYSIARRHNVNHKQLASFNRLSRASRISPGQVISIPRESEGPLPQTVARNDARSVPIPAASPVRGQTPRVVRTHRIPVKTAAKTKTKPVRVASRGDVQLPSSRPKPAKVEAPKKRVAARKTLPSPAPLAGTRFRWPVRGRILSKFGPKPNGKHNDGINVAVPKGTSVKAAENGVVAYAGSELKGYGNLILVRHANNWVTAYAHNDKLVVKRGDKVKRGQIIAKAGRTGSVGKPQLHFELRKGSKPVDPLKHMADS